MKAWSWIAAGAVALGMAAGAQAEPLRVASPDGQVVVSFRAPGLGAFYGQEVAADGSFEFQVPVDAPLSGVVVAVDRSETPPVALSRVTLAAGATTDPILLVRQEPLAESYSPPALPGGMGASFDWDLLAGRRYLRPHFLAGGLDPWNVSEAMRCSGAPIADVSSGVERGPGLKDAALITAFLDAVKRI